MNLSPVHHFFVGRSRCAPNPAGLCGQDTTRILKGAGALSLRQTRLVGAGAAANGIVCMRRAVGRPAARRLLLHEKRLQSAHSVLRMFCRWVLYVRGRNGWAKRSQHLIHFASPNHIFRYLLDLCFASFSSLLERNPSVLRRRRMVGRSTARTWRRTLRRSIISFSGE